MSLGNVLMSPKPGLFLDQEDLVFFRNFSRTAFEEVAAQTLLPEALEPDEDVCRDGLEWADFSV